MGHPSPASPSRSQKPLRLLEVVFLQILLKDRVDGGEHSLLAMPGVTALQGGVPITVDGTVVGGIGVSGAQRPEDVEVAMAAALSIQGSE
jgi:uncharacterized protein GlcG (DUF336 family)